MEKQLINLTIFLMKDDVADMGDCLKEPNLDSTPLKQELGLEGKIYYSKSTKNPPRWKFHLDEFASTKIPMLDNISNKAVMIVKMKQRFLAIVFGHGRSFLKEECIERNFGLRVALNTIDPNKMRSVNAATIEDMVVNTQRQASYSTTQDQFGLNVTNDILKAITGVPREKEIGNHISGKDSLVVSVFMDHLELKTKLELYYGEYLKDSYKTNGFDWVDNIAEVRDASLKRSLDLMLCEAIENKQLDNLTIAPPETIEWEYIDGFNYTGMGIGSANLENYRLDLDPMDYFNSIRPEVNILAKIKRDRLQALNIDGTIYTVSNIYNAIVFQAEVNSNIYILSSGTWYLVNQPFFNRVNDFILSMVKVSKVSLPNCASDEKEGPYNERVAKSSPDYCLFDKKLNSVEYGPKSVEACDLFTKNKQFIHVKNRGYSSQLSHLFAQGRVSAECFASDESFRKQVSNKAKRRFGVELFDPSKKLQSDEFEVVYAIIHKKTENLISTLPFFSKVNLMMTAQELDRMHYKYSICPVQKEANKK